MQGRQFDLCGVDAPEAARSCETTTGSVHECGQAATAALRWWIGAAEVSRAPHSVEVADLFTAICRAEGTDLSAWVVAQGHALALRHVSRIHTPKERKGWVLGAGLRAGRFEGPANWRRAHLQTVAVANTGAKD